MVVRNLALSPLLSEGRGCEKPLGKPGLWGDRDGQRGGGRGGRFEGQNGGMCPCRGPQSPACAWRDVMEPVEKP